MILFSLIQLRSLNTFSLLRMFLLYPCCAQIYHRRLIEKPKKPFPFLIIRNDSTPKLVFSNLDMHQTQIYCKIFLQPSEKVFKGWRKKAHINLKNYNKVLVKTRMRPIQKKIQETLSQAVLNLIIYTLLRRGKILEFLIMIEKSQVSE